jgi:hypothetical protein
MAFKKIKEGASVNVENIYVTVTCPVCEGSVTMKMKKSETRKNCPKCNRATYVFVILNMRGGINVSAGAIVGEDRLVQLNISPEDVEIAEEE